MNEIIEGNAKASYDRIVEDFPIQVITKSRDMYTDWSIRYGFCRNNYGDVSTRISVAGGSGPGRNIIDSYEPSDRWICLRGESRFKNKDDAMLFKLSFNFDVV